MVSAKDAWENPEAFLVRWHGSVIGTFMLNGGTSAWKAKDGFENFFVSDPKTDVPVWIRNLAPQGWLKQNLKGKSQLDYLRQGLRFLSNTSIYPADEAGEHEEKLDTVQIRLAAQTDALGIFKGKNNLPQGICGIEGFDNTVADLWSNRHMPRFSGAQMKIPATLSYDTDNKAQLHSATDSSFSHIAKYPSMDGRESLGVNEFMCMQAAKAAGMKTPAFALIEQDGDLPPLYVVERYDIPPAYENDDGSVTYRITQDFCTLSGKAPSDFTKGSMESLIKVINKELDKIDETPEQKTIRKRNCMEGFFKRAALAWMSNDEDMHLKNISMLYTYDSADRELTDITVAPVYDSTCDAFANAPSPLCLPLVNGKSNDLTHKDFVAFGEKCGLEKAWIEKTVYDMANEIADSTQQTFGTIKQKYADTRWFIDTEVAACRILQRCQPFIPDRALTHDGENLESAVKRTNTERKHHGGLARQNYRERTIASGAAPS